MAERILKKKASGKQTRTERRKSGPPALKSRKGLPKSPPSEAVSEPLLSRPQQLEIYYWMKLTRAVDDQLSRLYRQGKLAGGAYSSLGQEATACASAYALGPADYVGPMIRDLGAMLVRGFRPQDVFAQYMGKATSPTGGKDGSSHFGDLKRGVVAPISHLGSLIPVLAGIGMASRMLGRNSVCLTYVGDGGAQVGEVHEGLNFAAVQRCPLILIIENNGWAYSTPTGRESAVKDLAERARGYGMPGVVVDGNDAPEVYRVTREAVERARAGHGPTLIEAKTMRMKGHAEHDSASYVPPEMLAEWRTRDPVARLEKHLQEQGWLDDSANAALEERIRAEVSAGVVEAEAAPMPPPERALEGVFCGSCHEVPRVEPVWTGKQSESRESQVEGQTRP